jgi:hypothetical protein
MSRWSGHPDSAVHPTGSGPDPNNNVRMRPAPGFLTVRQRRLAWLGFLLLGVQAPVAAIVIPDDSWMLGVVVALIVGIVILADDAARRRPTED